MIPGFFISIATFPGVMIHELAHAMFCQLTGTRIHKVCYFRLGNPAGYVVHDIPTNVWKHILIGVGPLFINTLLGLAFGLAAAYEHVNFDKLTLTSGLYLWLAVSVAMHSFPSTGDARSIWHSVWSKGAPITAKLIGTPLVAIIFLDALGSIFWLDLIYGFGIVLELPKLFFPNDFIG